MDTTTSDLTTQPEFQHWQYKFDDEHVMWLQLNRQNSAVNSLDRFVLAELETLLNYLWGQTPSLLPIPSLPTALVIYSAKSNGFIAGADITQFTQIKTMDDALALMLQAQTVLAKLAALPIPTLALIHGYCLGGGLEFALACRYRLAADSANTSLGLPEVHLGLHPGWGGTVRLPQLIGVPHAMQMMLTGESISASQALTWGLVDAVVPQKELLEYAQQFIVQLKTKTPLSEHSSENINININVNVNVNANVTESSTPTTYNKLLNMSRILWDRCYRFWVSDYYYRWLNQRVNTRHYPAARVIIDNWRQDGACGQAAYTHEAESIARLMMTETSQQLTRLFLAKAKMKSLGRNAAHPLRRLHIIGCGNLGSALALKAVQQGFNVSLHDVNHLRLDELQKSFPELLKTKKINLEEKQLLCQRLIIDKTGEHIKTADAIIEAVTENLKIKQTVLTDAVTKMQPNALLLTTTSTLKLEELTQASPELNSLLLGFHTFLPLFDTEVIEIIKQAHTDMPLVTQAAALATRLGFLPVMAPAASGYLLLRVLLPYLMEAMYLLDEGNSITDIDTAAGFFGMKIGPLKLADAIGLEVCASLMKQMPELNEFPIPRVLKYKLAVGQLGLNHGQGFYAYPSQFKHYSWQENNTNFTKAKRLKDNASLLTDQLVRRLIPALLNSAIRVKLEDKMNVINNNDIFDAALVYGGGFAAFRGGPLNYAQYYRLDNLRALLQQLKLVHGVRYQPAFEENLKDLEEAFI